jgi:nucleoside-triphosphatase THEP1
MSLAEVKLAAMVYSASQGGHADAILSSAARQLRAEGLRLAGAVQDNKHRADRCRCDMTLEDLATKKHVQISVDQGPESTSCSLDSSALEEIVGLVCASLESGADLLIVNKFGKREAEGRGFRQALEFALNDGVPALVAVNEHQLADWAEFTGGLDERLSLDESAISDWCRSAAKRLQGA